MILNAITKYASNITLINQFPLILFIYRISTNPDAEIDINNEDEEDA